MDEYKEALDALTVLAKNIYGAIDGRIETASYDITKKATVTAILPENYYQIKMNDILYKVKSRVNKLSVGDHVDVLIPQNRMEDMYILCSQKGFSSSGSGSVTGLSGAIWEDFE